MKKVIVLVGLMAAIVSCEKLDWFDKEKECDTLTREELPAGLTAKFDTAYPNATSTIWFDKDGKNFVAVFLNSGVETDAVYDRSGNFVSQEVESDDDNDDENEEDEGCECDLESED